RHAKPRVASIALFVKQRLEHLARLGWQPIGVRPAQGHLDLRLKLGWYGLRRTRYARWRRRKRWVSEDRQPIPGNRGVFPAASHPQWHSQVLRWRKRLEANPLVERLRRQGDRAARGDLDLGSGQRQVADGAHDAVPDAIVARDLIEIG